MLLFTTTTTTTTTTTFSLERQKIFIKTLQSFSHNKQNNSQILCIGHLVHTQKTLQVKVKVKQSHYRPVVAQRVSGT